MRALLLAVSWGLFGYVLGFWTQHEHLELLYARGLILEERVKLQGLALNRMWSSCVGVEEAHGAGR